MKTELALHERTLSLHRYPKRNNETLQAWDAGDEYLINHVEAMNLDTPKHIVILNLYDMHKAKVYGLCLRLIADEEYAQDATQDRQRGSNHAVGIHGYQRHHYHGIHHQQ